MASDKIERTSRWLWPYGALFGVVMAAMWPIWTSVTRVLADDVLFFAYPLEVLRRDALARGEFPFWNPYWLSGIPAYPNPEAGFAYLPDWLLVWLPSIPALNWNVTLHVVLAAIAAAWCAGKLGATREGQFLSGVTWALGSAIVQRIWPGHLNYIQAFAWLPLATGLAATIGQSSRVTIYLALTVAMMTLAGRPDIFVFSAVWLPVWAVAGTTGGPKRIAEALVRTGIGLTLGLALAAIQLVPFAAMLAVSNRFTGLSARSQTLASLPPWHLLTQFSPRAFGIPASGDLYWPGQAFEWHERLFYIGIVPLVASLAAVKRWRRVCWGLAIAALLLAFGRFTPVYGWVQWALPVYRSFRVPGRHLGLAVLSLALAAGLGLPRLTGRKVAAVTFVAGLIILAAALTAAQWLPVFVTSLGGTGGPTQPSGETMAVHAVPGLLITSALLAIIAATALLPSPWCTRAQLVLAVLDLVFVLGPFRTKLIDPRGVVDALGALRGHQRAAVLGSGSGQLANFGPIIKVTQPGGNDNLVGSRYAALLLGASNADATIINSRRADDPVLALLGVEIVFDAGRPPVVPWQPPSPPAWVARCARPGDVTDIRRPDFPLKSCVMLPSATERDLELPPRPARILSQTAGALTVRADGPGWLVTTQPWYPGWRARVDEQPTEVTVVDGALLGVRLPEGDHTVDLSYRPAGLTAGTLTSGATALILAGWWWLERKKRAKETPETVLTSV